MKTNTKAPVSNIARSYLMLCVLLAIPTVTFAQAKVDETVLKNLQWRSIGPANMGGRIDDIAVVESNTNIFYVGAATGGVWKTTNNGTTFEPLFDEQGSTSIGDIAIAPNDPNIIWVGTGEPNKDRKSTRLNSSHLGISYAVFCLKKKNI